MEEKLQLALSDLIQKTLQGVDATKDFLTAEIPDVVYQLLLWHGIYNFIKCFLSIIFFIISIIIIRSVLLNKRAVEWDGYFFNSGMVWETIRGCLSLVVLIISVCNVNFIWLQIWLAPKVWLIEYMGSLVK